MSINHHALPHSGSIAVSRPFRASWSVEGAIEGALAAELSVLSGRSRGSLEPLFTVTS